MESEENNQEELIPYAIRSGLIVGLCSIMLVLIVYIIDYAFLVSLTYSLISLVVIAALVVFFGNRYRNMGSGYLSFGPSFKLSFTIFAFFAVVQVIFSMVLYNIIDPELPELISEQMIENMESLYRSMGMSQSQIDEQIVVLEQEIPEQFEPVTQLKNSWVLLLTSSFFALITAAIIKRKEPIVEDGRN